jgi:O-acetyl-ADP-ribose deacetylase (regulator of RNase III)
VLINGNLLDARTDFIAHQVNCQGAMGSGVALAIRRRYPKVYEEYMKICSEYTSMKLLGQVQYIQLYLSNNPQPPYYCINIFAQSYYGYGGKQYTSIDAFRQCLININENCKGKTVAFPWLIGCVRGGADWNEILPLICSTLTDVSQIYFYKL